jgi:FKBP-type peptidyl-prolyl cis-trans isomerase SlyD
MENKLKIQDHMVVKLKYVLSADGNRLGNCEPDPVVYLHGHNQIIPGFEKRVSGLSVGESITFEVEPDEGYGYREEEAKIDMPKADYPQGLPMVLGAELQMVNDDGDEIPGWLTEISDNQLTIDFNHPLANKTLHFEVEILDIREGTPEEIQNHDVGEF